MLCAINPSLEHTKAIHILASPTLHLYLGGLIGSIITYVTEVFVFSWVIKNIFRNNFILSSISSISTTILVHNLILYPYVISDKDLLWKIFWNNFFVNFILILIYTICLNTFFKRIYTKSKR